MYIIHLIHIHIYIYSICFYKYKCELCIKKDKPLKFSLLFFTQKWFSKISGPKWKGGIRHFSFTAEMNTAPKTMSIRQMVAGSLLSVLRGSKPSSYPQPVAAISWCLTVGKHDRGRTDGCTRLLSLFKNIKCYTVGLALDLYVNVHQQMSPNPIHDSWGVALVCCSLTAVSVWGILFVSDMTLTHSDAKAAPVSTHSSLAWVQHKDFTEKNVHMVSVNRFFSFFLPVSENVFGDRNVVMLTSV